MSAIRRQDLPAVLDTLTYYAGWADKIQGTSADLDKGGRDVHAYSLKEPIGVVGLIIPWNAPLAMAAWKLAPALAAGLSTQAQPAASAGASFQAAIASGAFQGMISATTPIGSLSE